MFRLIIVGVLTIELIALNAIAQDPVSFNRDIRPILSDHCFRCHGPDEAQRQGGLRLDLQEFAFQVAESGHAAIVPGNVSASVLLQRVHATDPDEQMPPSEIGKPLKPAQVELLERWIKEGAKYEGHWAFIKPPRPTIPSPKSSERVENEIDRFLLANLESRGFSYAPEATREILLRRVTLDLTGLPPTPAEVNQFLADKSPDAYEKVVDRLLKSPRYGEQMAVQWLDLARYADSNGYQVDSSRFQWPWRDWVIEAFNQNMPYDQFTIEQLAGDLLPEANLAQKIATGFHRNHRLNGEGGIIAEEWRVETVIDRVETTGLTWLGLTFNCCRCHDHKYDPISQREFYSMFSYFNNIAESGTLQGESRNTDPTITVLTPEQETQLASLKDAVANSENELQALVGTLPQLVAEWEPGFREQLKTTVKAWTVLEPESVASPNGTVLTKQTDGSYLASGPNPSHDVYEIKASLAAGKWSGLLLECFTDPSLPHGSLGRFPNGNFVLSRVEAQITAPSLSAPLVAKFTRAVADYSQSGWDIQNTITQDSKKGWAVDGPTRIENRQAMFLNESVLTIPADAKISIRIIQESLGQHNIGRFRVSTSGLPLELVSLSELQLPESLKQTLSTPAEQRTEAQTKELHDYFQKNVDSPIRKAEAKVAESKKQLAGFQNSLPTVMVMQESPSPREAFVLVRGQYDQRGETVTASVPKVFPPLPADA
ncbi:MAG: DUF1549 domain-containing protein, partial [Pirellulaceae bacterium]